MSSQHLLSPIPEQHARRGRSRNARPRVSPRPILPPFPDNREEKTKVASKNNTKNLRWKKHILAAAVAVERVEEDSRNDEVNTRIHDDEVLRSTIASWKQPQSRLIVSSSLGRDDQPPDIDTTPSDEQPLSDRVKRPVRCGVGASSNADISTRDQYQLSRLKARVHQRNVRPLGYGEEKKLNLKHLRASRIQVVRGLYKNNNQEVGETENEHENEITADAESVVSSVRDLSTLSSYRGKCFDKMVYLLNDVAPLEEGDVPCSVNDEGTNMSSNAGGKISVAELKLIKKRVLSKMQERNDESDIGDESVAFPEEIDQPDTDTIVSKFSDVTSPTIQDGFEMDEVPHFPILTAARKTNVSSTANPQGEYLPSLAEVNESSEDLPASAGGSKSTDNLNIKEASRILGSTSSSIQKTVEGDEATEVKKIEGSPNDADEVDAQNDDQDRSIEEITSILNEREAEMKAAAMEEKQRRTADKNREDETIDTKPLPVVKHVTFFEPLETEIAVPQTHCCIIM
eukprot:scaffold6528_cov211-Skeletonema_marinoi.AAC.9